MSKERIGQRGIIETKKPRLVVEVTVLDHKALFGSDRYLVAPVAGSGTAWVENVSFKKK
jgi:hypothetical protein